MAINALLLKSPFFKVRIGPPNSKPDQLVSLPTSIARLIDTFEYTQFVDGGQGSASKIRLTFVEDSRQGIDTPGSVLDLFFDKGNTIRSISPQDVGLSKLQVERLQIAQTAIDNPGLASPDPDKTEDLKESERKVAQKIQDEIIKSKSAHTFVLQENNTIEVTWGYNDYGSSPKLAPRTTIGQILRITHRASGDSVPVTEIDALDLGAGEFSKLRRIDSKNWTVKEVKDTLTSAGKKSLLDSLDRNSKTTFWQIAKDDDPARIDGIVHAVAAELPNTTAEVKLTTEELNRDVQESKSGRVQDPNTDLHEFLKKEAEKTYAHYYVTSRKTSKGIINVIHLTSRSDFESSAKFTFGWKGAGSSSANVFNTMKSYNLALMPEGGDGAASKGIDSEKKQETGSTAKITANFVGPGTVQYVQQTSGEIQKATNSLAIVSYNESSSTNDHEAMALAYAGRMERALMLDFVTVGIPQLSPGAIEVLNIGKRYSGTYYALAVTHKITADEGYICTVQANTNAIAAGGITAKNNNPVTTNPPDIKANFVKEPGKSPFVDYSVIDSPSQGK